jgi:hypothetical protein
MSPAKTSRQQAGSYRVAPDSCCLQRRSQRAAGSVGANLFAKRPVQTKHPCRLQTRLASKLPPTVCGAPQLSWEGACSRQGKYRPRIHVACKQVSPASRLIQLWCAAILVGANLFAKRPAQAKHPCRLQPHLASKLASTESPKTVADSHLFEPPRKRKKHPKGAFVLQNSAY